MKPGIILGFQTEGLMNGQRAALRKRCQGTALQKSLRDSVKIEGVMKIAHDLQALANDTPAVLTIGNFDGMHLGHQAVLNAAQTLAKQKNVPFVALTFANHPSEVLRPHQKTALICTSEHRIKLLASAGIDLLILLTFTKELSQQSPEEFLRHLHACIPFSDLILGHDATLGKDREGSKDRVIDCLQQLGANVHYIAPVTVEDHPVSSSRIRKLIQSGDFLNVEKLLGRKYSVYASVIKGQGKGSPLGYPTANISVENLCLPPLGVYAVRLFVDGKRMNGVANLGVAPTVRKDPTSILEIHLYDSQVELLGKCVEVEFHAFLRSEQKFPNFDALKEQIRKDISEAKKIFNIRFDDQQIYRNRA